MKTAAKIVLLILLLYLFLLSIGLMGSSFKLLGKDGSLSLLDKATGSPILGLLIGILTTSLIQSSSTVTSMVVAIVASGQLDVSSAIPIIMGANIGTTVTNTIVSVSHITQKQEFRRAFAAATVHDFFNLMIVMIFLPLEMATHFIQNTATLLAHSLGGVQGFKSKSVVKEITKPVIHKLETTLQSLTGWENEVGWIMVIMSFAMIFFCLYFLTKLLKGLLAQKLEIFFDRFVNRNAIYAIGLGVAMTVLVQSSSITTSLLVPLAGSGIITLRQVFPVTLGANIGTTVTALLASMAVLTHREEALTIALCHLLFNIFGTLLIYPVPSIRNIPLRCAEWISEEAIKSKTIVLFYLLGIFFGLPGLMIYITSLF